MLNNLKQDLENLKNKEKAIILARFFKTGKGQYGEGDQFLGIVVPIQRKIAKKYIALSLNEIQQLLSNNIHEFRLTALLIVVEKYKQADSKLKEEIYKFYLSNTKFVNNWDLVDLTAPNIVGDFLLEKDKSILYKLAKSDNLWERRISIISTLNFIRKNQFQHTLEISKILLFDKHDLIQKAVGWMLRELGKKNQELEESFLNENYKTMSRTTLRYSIEKFTPEKKSFFMKK